MAYDVVTECISRICRERVTDVDKAFNFKDTSTDAYLKNNNISVYTFKTITPNESKRTTFEISYGFQPTLFGKCFMGIAEKDICHISFVDHDEISAIEMLKKEWPQAQLREDAHVETMIQNIFMENSTENNIHLLLKGTDFQIKVWQALTSIPEGVTTNYENIAYIIGKPKAVRAAANAIANNPISYLIPCHRIISKSGKIHKYRWGADRKKAILDYETSKCITWKVI